MRCEDGEHSARSCEIVAPAAAYECAKLRARGRQRKPTRSRNRTISNCAVALFAALIPILVKPCVSASRLSQEVRAIG